MHGRHDALHHHFHPHDHNQPESKAAQWQTPHDPGASAPDAPQSDEVKDLDLVEKAFCEAFDNASDPTSFLRLAGVPFSGVHADGRTLQLLRVEKSATTDIGSIMPRLGGASFQYAPLPASLASRRDALAFVYFDGEGLVTLDLAEAKRLDLSTPD